MYPARLTARPSISCLRLGILCKHLDADADVLLETRNKAGVITLNRPKALNALNLNMIRKIYPVLKRWESDSNVGLVMIRGTGEKAFCAGGDVRAVADAGLKGEDLTKDFFREEYMLNHIIGTLQTPYVALINGITMGGGVGLSVHGHFRVATERTLFAMPETAIGLFPDVGGGFSLPRMAGRLGFFLALTGQRLKGYDVKHTGIATHFVTTDQLADLESSLLSLEDPNTKEVEDVLDNFDKKCSKEQNPEFVLAKQMEQINRCFSHSTMEEIMVSLKEDGSDWAVKQMETLNKMSPTSMKVTLRQLENGAKMDLGECLKMEYRLSQRFMEDKDFFEGIRAVLVDKDNSPKWNPSSLEGVSKEKVDSYFESLGDQELVL